MALREGQPIASPAACADCRGDWAKDRNCIKHTDRPTYRTRLFSHRVGLVSSIWRVRIQGAELFSFGVTCDLASFPQNVQKSRAKPFRALVPQ
jgi:hypothetical protein